MQRFLNTGTMDFKEYKLFNNWQTISHGWYFAFPSNQLKKGKIKSTRIGRQHIVIFRTNKGKVKALDGYCPHMGVDLNIGKVVGENIQCFFHHWQFNGEGVRKKVSCNKNYKEKKMCNSHFVLEQFGVIWIYPGDKAPENFPTFDQYPENQKFDLSFDKNYIRKCHYHTAMINGLDAQHLHTVHGLSIDMDINIKQTNNIFRVNMDGKMPKNNFKEKLGKFFLGKNYGYSMKYYDGTVGLLTMMRKVKLFNKWNFPELTMLFAYRPADKNQSEVFPVYLTKKRKGILGKIKSKFLLFLTKRCFYMLRDEDGLVYDNMRFSINNPIKEDWPVLKFINYINSLSQSLWVNEAISINSSKTSKQTTKNTLRINNTTPSTTIN